MEAGQSSPNIISDKSDDDMRSRNSSGSKLTNKKSLVTSQPNLSVIAKSNLKKTEEY